MKRILFVSAFPPNQKTAGQDYSRRLIDDLISRGYHVSLIYANYPKHEIELNKEVEVLGIINPSFGKCISKLHYFPLFSRRFDKGVLRQIQSIAEQFDILYFDYSQVHIYAKYIAHPKKILMCHDIIAQKYRRKRSILLPYIKRTESKLLNAGHILLTFSKKDNDILKELYNKDAIAINFYIKSGKYKYLHEKIHEKKFCLYGAWNRAENIESLTFFVDKILPELNKNVIIEIIGGGMKIKEQKLISTYANVRYLGFVDDPIQVISENQALIAPLHFGAGVKVKVIDALSSGTPVIGTDIAFEGIEDNANRKLLFKAESPREYINLINNWEPILVKEKQMAANEFFAKYNGNHLPDILNRL